METLCFNPTGELLLFGPTLWDPRAPRCIHVFDLLSYSACSSFHPAGLEAVVNSEVCMLVLTLGNVLPVPRESMPMPDIPFFNSGPLWSCGKLRLTSQRKPWQPTNANESVNLMWECFSGVGPSHAQATALCAVPGQHQPDMERQRRLCLCHAAPPL